MQMRWISLSQQVSKIFFLSPVQNFMEKPLQTENLEIKLTKKVKDLYTENYKTLSKANWSQFKEMERYPVLLDGRILY